MRNTNIINTSLLCRDRIKICGQSLHKMAFLAGLLKRANQPLVNKSLLREKYFIFLLTLNFTSLKICPTKKNNYSSHKHLLNFRVHKYETSDWL